MNLEEVIRIQFLFTAISLPRMVVGARGIYMFYFHRSDIAAELRDPVEALAARPADPPFARPSDDGKFQPKF